VDEIHSHEGAEHYRGAADAGELLEAAPRCLVDRVQIGFSGSGRFRAGHPKAHQRDFRRGIIYSGNFGRDADTISAIVGAISGAMNGMSSIPPRWIEKVRLTTGVCLPFTKGMDLFDVASQLADLVQ